MPALIEYGGDDAEWSPRLSGRQLRILLRPASIATLSRYWLIMHSPQWALDLPDRWPWQPQPPNYSMTAACAEYGIDPGEPSWPDAHVVEYDDNDDGDEG